MRYIKMLGLAAIAAAAVTAFLGAGSASANVLCKTTSTPCNSTSTTLEASLTGTARLETTSGVLLDTCTIGGVKGSIENEGANIPASGKVSTENLTWSGCTKTTKTLEGGSLTVDDIAGTENGTVTATGFVVTVNTIFGSCTYGFGSSTVDLGTLEGGTSPKLVIKTEVPKITGPCPETSVWNATYVITNPSPLYVEPS